MPTLMDDFEMRRWYLSTRLNDEYMHRKGLDDRLHYPDMPPLPCYSGVEDEWVEELLE